MGKKQATIADVAKAAMVSKTTVSRYINGKLGHMSEETKGRIADVIKELDYRPVKAARALKMKRSGTIGCIIADITSPFSSILVKGVNDMCVESGYDLIMLNTDNNPDREMKAIETLMSHDVEGLIVNASGKNNEYLLKINSEVPIVMADRPMEGGLIDSITSDNYDATFGAMSFLLKQGFERIALFVENPTDMTTRKQRKNAYLKTISILMPERTELDEDLYIVNTQDSKKTLALLKSFKEKSGPRAVFCANGVVLLHILQVIFDNAYKIPEDFGVIGYDDWGWASITTPPITTIKQNSYEIGRECVKQIIKRINEKEKGEPIYKEVATRLMIRDSTTLNTSKEKLKNE